MKSTRTYTMHARAESAAATRQRILDAATDLLRIRLRTDVRVADVASAAGVSEMTVLRLFGTKAALMTAALAEARSAIVTQRQAAEQGDVGGSIAALFDHYEQVGDLVITNLAEAGSDPEIAEVVRLGRIDHRRWVLRQFGPQLAGLSRADRDLLVDALVAVCDVYTWKRLRRDLGRSRRRAEAIVRLMAEGVLGANPAKPL